MSVVRVASWNLFHGRAVPPVRADLLPDYAAALAAADWDVCGLQECPPWFARPLAEACGASLRVARTSLLRGLLPGLQRAISAPDPERLGVRGAAVNALLVRPAAGRVVEHRVARLRRAPQRRTVHAVRLDLPAHEGTRSSPRAGGRPTPRSLWIANVHTHNRPESAATADLARAIGAVTGWAAGGSAVLLGDLNVHDAAARELAGSAGLAWLAGDRVDHILGTPGVSLTPGGHRTTRRPKTLDGAAVLSDHRLLGASVTLP